MSSFVSGTIGNEAAQKFLEILQLDFKHLGQETKKKYPQIKEVCLLLFGLIINPPDSF